MVGSYALSDYAERVERSGVGVWREREDVTIRVEGADGGTVGGGVGEE